MIIGENFIWLHFPKCAGTFTENLLRKYFGDDKSLSFDKIDPSNVIWHQNVSEREKMLNIDLSGKDILCNIRRLPFWIISRIRYERNRSGKFVTREMYNQGKFYTKKGEIISAECVLGRMTEKKVRHWIKVEFLKSDLISVFSKYLDIKSDFKSDDFTLNINSSGDRPQLNKWFKYEELVVLYNSCPLWSELEQKLYGNLLVDLIE